MSIAILHEGQHIDRYFLNDFIKYLKLDKAKVEYYPVGNKSNFYKKNHKVYIELMDNIDSERINKILFILDADHIDDDRVYGGYENTKKELNDIRKSLKIQDISDVCITRKPNKNYGNLESLILSTISEEEKKCISTFLECSNFKDKENSKAIFHQLYKLSYPKKPFNFEHKNFNDLKGKLKNLFK